MISSFGDAIKVLVVENEVLTAQDISLRLTKMAFQIIGVARNYDSAIALLEEHPAIKIALIDIEIDGHKDGIELAETGCTHGWVFEGVVLSLRA